MVRSAFWSPRFGLLISSLTRPFPDVPSHSYQLSFESWPKWKNFFAGAPEILEYWKRVTAKYDVGKHIRFEQKCIRAHWSKAATKWFVTIRDLKTGLIYEDNSDILMTGEGVLNEWKWPDIEGLDRFQGTLLHSANWEAQFDPKVRIASWRSAFLNLFYTFKLTNLLQDKSVAVIGAGSSGIQIVPALEPAVRSMDHYVRGRTWISSTHGAEEIKRRTDGKGGNPSYTIEEMELWDNNRDAYLEYRRGLELQMQSRIAITFSGSPQQAEAYARFTADMKRRLQNKPEIIEHLIPTFSPLCKRLTPGPGYLEALTSPKVNVIPTAISHVDERGIFTIDGVHRPVEAIVCATGFQTSPGARGFPIYGREGINLRERYAQRPETYLGLCTGKFPNFFQSLGPNGFQGAGNLLIMIEATHSYVGQILEKMAYENVGIIEPKGKSVDAFTNYCEEYFQRTVYVEECDSWYKSAPPGSSREEKRRGRVTAIWPGSSLHAVRTLRSVRWEDFNMQSYDGNDFGWFGNGTTAAERNPTPENIKDFTWYLDSTNILKE